MKLENNQSYITNLQFSGGQPVGSGSINAATIASGSAQTRFDISGSLTATGSLKVTNPFCRVYNYFLTASTTVNDATSQSTGSTQYVAVSGSNTQKAQIIASRLTANQDLFLSASVGATALAVTASFGGSDGNKIIISAASASSTLTNQLGAGTGTSNWPYQMPFTAQGLYIALIGNLTCTTQDGSVLTFTSASGFIPGIVTAISSSSTALGIIALK
jgi:hypothetical protein